MIKFFVSGDWHFGKHYDRYANVKDFIIQSRFECLKKCVEQAEKEDCDFFVITGDLFDNTGSIKKDDVKAVAEILAGFGGRVLVLPGNHDYYNGNEKVWKDFVDCKNKLDGNIIFINSSKEYEFEVRDESVIFYPAFCDAKHSNENKLGWIKTAEMSDADYHVGLAHGAIEGITPDMKGEYFPMTERELRDIPVDAWFIGHTHVPYPKDLNTGSDTEGYKVFNAGSPEQLDSGNNSKGQSFVITLDKEDGKTKVLAHVFESNGIRYFELDVKADGVSLKTAIEAAVKDLPESSVVILNVSGAVPAEEYADRGQIYKDSLGGFLTYETNDSELSELITKEKINSEFAEFGFAAQLLGSIEDPKELQMAYELVKKYKK